ncbi:MAG: alanine--glyoxylate aminotransferase family protein [Gemmatimonadetes bacterium]|nr:alanine--glyoxylate aminotransferase family protein [Gemmatimonadota bacterium]
MKKMRLYTPGPVMIPEDTMLAMARPIDHHRTSEFRQMHEELSGLLKYLFQTKHTCLTFTGSGTSGAEAAIAGCLPEGHKALVYRNGKFAERWAKVCASYGISHETVDIEWGNGVKAEDVEKRLSADSTIDTVIVVHSETSTTAFSDVEAIAAVTRKHNALLLVDGITAVGCLPVKMDQWGVDVYITGSQKALMLPPGLAFVAAGPRALAAAASATAPRSYWSWSEQTRFNDEGFFPYTPATGLLFGLDEALTLLAQEGLPAVFARHARHAAAARAAVEAWDLECFAERAHERSVAATTVLLPAGHSADALRSVILERCDMSIGGGLGRLADRVIRIGHLGDFNDVMLLGTLGGVELGLRVAGIPHRPGGAQAALALLADTAPHGVDSTALG